MALPSSPLDGLLCGFGSNINNFALATPDGRVRTYDTGAQHQQQHKMVSAAAVAAQTRSMLAAGLNMQDMGWVHAMVTAFAGPYPHK